MKWQCCQCTPPWAVLCESVRDSNEVWCHGRSDIDVIKGNGMCQDLNLCKALDKLSPAVNLQHTVKRTKLLVDDNKQKYLGRGYATSPLDCLSLQRPTQPPMPRTSFNFPHVLLSSMLFTAEFPSADSPGWMQTLPRWSSLQQKPDWFGHQPTTVRKAPSLYKQQADDTSEVPTQELEKRESS